MNCCSNSLNALRLKDGVASSTFDERTGLSLAVIAHQLRQLETGLLDADPDSRLRATPLGRRFLNDLAGNVPVAFLHHDGAIMLHALHQYGAILNPTPPSGKPGGKPGTHIASLVYASRRARPSTCLSNGDDMASPKDVLKQIADNEVTPGFPLH